MLLAKVSLLVQLIDVNLHVSVLLHEENLGRLLTCHDYARVIGRRLVLLRVADTRSRPVMV